MALKNSSDRKLTELMTNHIFINNHRIVIFTVMYSNGMTNHLRENNGTPGTSLDRSFTTCSRLNLFDQMVIKERTLFC
ncbi:hypothetical protein XFFB_08630 [Xylella fastidiosa]|nr:hypothetical protein XFFB_08630 [Xylella fastidiosa]OCA58318.1 hypothetical protein AA93_04850 [Xylella fastidiosa subsp. pauca 11399]